MQRILARHDTNQGSDRDKSELEQILPRLEQDGVGFWPKGRRRSGIPGRDGPSEPEEIVEHGVTFNADKDGKLSRDESRPMIEEFARRHRPRRGRAGDQRP